MVAMVAPALTAKLPRPGEAPLQFGGLTVPLGPLEPMVRAMLAPSVATDPLEDMDEIISDIENRQAQAWLINDGPHVRGVVVTQIIEGSNGHRQCLIQHCAGQGIKDWLHFLDRIEWYARHVENCQSIEMIGRKGFERLLPGWEKQAIVLRKEL